MRIAHVISYFQPEFGYEEYYMAREQAAMGHEVHVVTSDRIFPFKNVGKMLSDIGSPYKDRKRPEGVKEVDGFTVHRNRTRMEILYDFMIFRDAARTLSAIKPDVVHAHGLWPWSTYQAARNRERIGYGLILDEHGYATTYDLSKNLRNWVLDKEYRMIRAPLARYSLKRADGVVAVSGETEEFLRSFYNCRDVRMIPLGVDERNFKFDKKKRDRVRRSLGLDDKFVLITAGRLERAKRIESLIEAVRRIESDRIRLVVVGSGDGDYLSELKKKADGRVVFTGFKRPEELSELYCGADLAFFGKASITIREAMSCSLPLLLFDNEDMRSLLKWDNGTAVRDDPKVLADEIVRLMDSPGLLKKMGNNGRVIVEAELSNRAEAEKLLDLYASVGFK
ncbi:MAG: glycosyltransferase family 4 protein [Thermoplasmatota archaeon]